VAANNAANEEALVVLAPGLYVPDPNDILGGRLRR
jgi:hypothetical protein